MRRPFLSLLALTLALLLPATDLCGQELAERKAAALDKPFVHAARWFTDFGAAKAEATRTKRPIFAYFSRSYRP